MEYHIYKICCKNSDIKDCYVGSTKNINKRIIHHKYSCNNKNSNNSDCYVYKFINENGNWSNWEVIIIETIICETKKDILIRERYWIEFLKASLNSRSSYKRKIDNSKRCKDWRLSNGKITCSCNLVISRSNLSRHLKSKNHLETNKENLDENN